MLFGMTNLTTEPLLRSTCYGEGPLTTKINYLPQSNSIVINSSLQKLKDKPELWPELLQQLSKDLGSKIEVNDPSELPVVLKVHLESNIDKLGSFLYRVDIPEDKARSSMTKEDPLEALSAMILEREVQKVIFRAQSRS